MKALVGSIRVLVGRVMRLRPVRVFQFYTQNNGPILAGGLSLTLLYSVFAGIYVGFSVFGIVVASNEEFKDAVVRTVSNSVPGLLNTGHGGAITIDDLFQSHSLGIASIVALVAVFVTALSWFSSARSAVRLFFGLQQDKTFFLLLKLKDLALVIGFGLVTIASAGISVFSTSALDFLFDLVGIDHHSPFATLVARVVGLAIVLVIDTLTLATLFRVLAATRIPWRRLLVGSLLGGVGLGVLKVLGATIVGGAGRNPLLASFAVILGLLVWMGLVCQVILLSATWIAVDIDDHGETLKPHSAKQSVVTAPSHHRPATRAVGPPR